jgi:serine protease inhibitor
MVISDKPRDLNPVAVQGDLSALAEGNAAFATDLYAALRHGPGNLFFSPQHSTALAMTYAGSAGDTSARWRPHHFDPFAERLHPASTPTPSILA